MYCSLASLSPSSSSWPSSHRKSYSLPSKLLKMPVFRKLFLTISCGRSYQALLTQEVTSARTGFFKFPPLVSGLSFDDIHSTHFCLNLSLNGLLMITFRGCRTVVSHVVSHAYVQVRVYAGLHRCFKTFTTTSCIGRTLVYKSPPQVFGKYLVQNFPTYTRIYRVCKHIYGTVLE